VEAAFEQEKRRIARAYEEFAAQFGPHARDIQFIDHSSLPGVKVMTIEPLRFHFEVDHDSHAVFVLNIFYAQPKLQ
jgi:hypothetical protein